MRRRALLCILRGRPSANWFLPQYSVSIRPSECLHWGRPVSFCQLTYCQALHVDTRPDAHPLRGNASEGADWLSRSFSRFSRREGALLPLFAKSVSGGGQEDDRRRGLLCSTRRFQSSQRALTRKSFPDPRKSLFYGEVSALPSSAAVVKFVLSNIGEEYLFNAHDILLFVDQLRRLRGVKSGRNDFRAFWGRLFFSLTQLKDDKALLRRVLLAVADAKCGGPVVDLVGP